MNFHEAKQYFLANANQSLEVSEREEIFMRLAEYLTQKTKIDFVTDKTIFFNSSELDNYIEALRNDKPIQYILGYEWFGNLKLKVNEHVLIPRPETEELAMWLVEDFKNGDKKIKILDIGTGSGCIPIYLKIKMPHAEIHALDISQLALNIAEENSDIYDVEIHFHLANILDEQLDLEQKFDIIISNPPYILPSEKSSMQHRVVDFEPSEALFVTNDDELQFYKAIQHFSKNHLNEHGKIYLESHQDYAKDVLNLFKSTSSNVSLRSDMYGNERMIKVAF